MWSFTHLGLYLDTILSINETLWRREPSELSSLTLVAYVSSFGSDLQFIWQLNY